MDINITVIGIDVIYAKYVAKKVKINFLATYNEEEPISISGYIPLTINEYISIAEDMSKLKLVVEDKIINLII
ncbi:MAG: hypothetical protein ABS939_03570 [Psychrobacillus sp.]